MKYWGTPAGAAMLVGLFLAIVSLFGLLPPEFELPAGAVVLVVFAAWLSRWIRYRVFGPGVWLGVFILGPTAILGTLFLPTYLAHHPDHTGAVTRGAFFGWALVSVVVYAFLLATLASLLAIGPRRRDQARMKAEAAAHATTP